MSLLDDDILEQVDNKILTVENAVNHFCKNKWPNRAIYFSELPYKYNEYITDDFVIVYNTYYGSQAIFVKIDKPSCITAHNFNNFNTWHPIHINMGGGIQKRLTIGFLKEMYGII